MQQIYIKLRRFFNGINTLLNKIPSINRDLIELEPLLTHIDNHFDQILEIYTQIMSKISKAILIEQNRAMEAYQSQLQHYQAKLRKQVAIGIELKLYYEELEMRIQEEKEATRKLKKMYFEELEYLTKSQLTKTKNKTPEPRKSKQVLLNNHFTSLLQTETVHKKKPLDLKTHKRSLSVKSVKREIEQYPEYRPSSKRKVKK